MNKEKRSLLKNDGVQSFIASIICILLGLLLGYVVLLFINPAGAGEAITSLVKNFFNYPNTTIALKYFGSTLVKTAPLLMCSLSILFAYKVGLFNIGAAGSTHSAQACDLRGSCVAAAPGGCACFWPWTVWRSPRHGKRHPQKLLQRKRGHLRHYAQLDNPLRNERSADKREGSCQPLTMRYRKRKVRSRSCRPSVSTRCFQTTSMLR